MWHRSLLWSCGLVVSRSVLLLSLSPLFHSSPPLSDPLSDPLLSSSERYLVEFKNKLLVEMLAVLFELLLEIGFLSFNDKIDQPLINALHYISVSILSLFVVEFGVYFFALGFKFCCRAWLLLDVIIVTVALITELYMHHRYNAADRTGEPGDDESEVITKEIIFVVTLRIIRIVHSLFTQFQRHEDRITASCPLFSLATLPLWCFLIDKRLSRVACRHHSVR